MSAALVFLMIASLRPEWDPGACDRVFSTEGNRSACIRRQVEGEAWGRSLAAWFVEEGERWAIDPAILVVIAWKEYSLDRGDRCRGRIDASRITSRELLDEDVDRWRFCWTYGAEGALRTNCQPVLLLADNEV